MTRIDINQIPLNSTSAVIVKHRTDRCVNYFIIPTTAVTVWMGVESGVTKTTGFPCTQGIPFSSTSFGADPTQDIWAISDSGTPNVAVYEEFLTDRELKNGRVYQP